MHFVSSCSLKQCPCRIECAAHVTTTSCCAFDRVRAGRGAAEECRGDPFGHSLAATLNHLAGDWIHRTAPSAARWLIPQTAKPACQRGSPVQRRRSNKPSLVICANFERGLFKNAARSPVDDFTSKSQN